MKRTLALLLALIALFGLVSCGDKNTDEKVLKIGMECDYAPFNWTQPTNANGAVKIVNVPGMYANGYDVQVALAIAAHLGMTAEIYSYEWDSLVPAVQSGTLDLIIAGMSPTADRKEKIDFSSNYYYSNLVVITKGDKLANVNTVADLAGKKIAAQSGTSHYTALSTQTTADYREMDDFSTMFMALQAGTIDGYIAEEPTAMCICGQSEEFSYIPLVNNETGFVLDATDSSIAVGVKKGSALLSSINEYLATFTTEAQLALMQEMANIAPSD